MGADAMFYFQAQERRAREEGRCTCGAAPGAYCRDEAEHNAPRVIGGKTREEWEACVTGRTPRSHLRDLIAEVFA